MVLLEDSKLAAQLGTRDVDGTLAIAREQHFAAGSEIFKEGETGDGLYVVKDGLVEISVLVGQTSGAWTGSLNLHGTMPVGLDPAGGAGSAGP